MKGSAIRQRVQNAAMVLGGEFKISQRGVPYFVIRNFKGQDYSVCYFGKTRNWKIFWPYLDYSGNQQRCTVKDINELRIFFTPGLEGLLGNSNRRQLNEG